MKINHTFVSGNNSPKSFQAYRRGDFDLESGLVKKSRKQKNSPLGRMIKSFRNKIHQLHPLLLLLICLSLLITLFIVYNGQFKMMPSYRAASEGNVVDIYPFANFKNLVMVAGHSVYTSSGCDDKVDKEDAWYLESYQKHPGQAATFITHIQKGVEIAANDDVALLLFSGGETRKDAGPRSEAQSYWTVAESKQWFGKRDSVRGRALTEEHARDSFENLLFSLCRFRELTGTYPHNITVVGYDFKEERFVHLHRSAIRFPESSFFYSGTPSTQNSREAALKGEAMVRSQFQEDPYGCSGSLRHKKLGRDPFHRTVPYPNGCPEIEGLFRYCGAAPYPGFVPWA
ncbi:hypothetical protein ABFS82_14G306700 [Erythranthe guttata]|uniref:DUF218 domain-containing protein n=1 Tax=Erythranthe guttata TaxID=4155 RepID=A0A022Q584_ERYGU|nr:PREDICTED: uncharacterized protein C57A10.07 [Erythranthe guttata]EYU23827.1 hypothetical protein MIMGU_mgv1a009420mg [Erythranthe guttata]|eukprot:XP_012853475.1 PREDICTED: uncharacterized protein C57A10.07 [Erythranthe guttata]